MDQLKEKFSKLGVDFAPGQENHNEKKCANIIGDIIQGKYVDFSHGDVDAFKPIPGSLDQFISGVNSGAEQAYTEYKGKDIIREDLSVKLSKFTGTSISADKELIITQGTQGALFLAMGSLITRGDKVAIAVPDYFANRKIAEFFDADITPIELDYFKSDKEASLDLFQLEVAFKGGVKLFLFSNPNNPTGVIYSSDEIMSIASLARKYNVSIIVDQLYSRQIFDNRIYTHLCAQDSKPDNLITIIGPSKTESLSGYRLGVAFGTQTIIDRMEKLQAIVSLRASGYNQSVLQLWFNEPKGWMMDRIASHQAIRDDLVSLLSSVDGIHVKPTEAGSYLFTKIPELKVTIKEFVRIVKVQANVSITPGTEFGSQFTNSFRINFSQDHKSAVDAIKRIIQLIERYRK